MRGLAICFLIFTACCVEAAIADPTECREAADKYDAALSDVRGALRAYAKCVSDSRGHDDCSAEFETLRSAQGDFESAVSAYESECQ